MNLTFEGLEWIAVGVAALAYFAIGALWYAPFVFGKIWMQAGGMQMPAEGQRPGPAIYVVPLIGSVLSSIVIGVVAQALNVDGPGDGAALGTALAVGFALPIALITATFESNKPKPMVWGAVNAGYHAAGIIVAGMIIGALPGPTAVPA